jgi:hypothetical protein
MARTTKRKFGPNCEGLEGRQLLSTYYVVNASSGKVLDDPAFSTSNGGNGREAAIGRKRAPSSCRE